MKLQTLLEAKPKPGSLAAIRPDILEEYNERFRFYCDNLGLTTLAGIPSKINHGFDCRGNNLKTLKDGPTDTGDYDCSVNKLKNLEGAPIIFRGDEFDCSANEALTSLKGCPPNVETFNCSNGSLKSLEGGPTRHCKSYDCNCNKLTTLVGAPEEVTNKFDCVGNNLSSFEGAPKVMGDFQACENKFKSLQSIHKHIKAINGFADFSLNPIKSHMLGLLKIEGLRYVRTNGNGHFSHDRAAELHQATEIINKHLKKGRNIFDCQAELEDAGLERFAQL